MVNVMSDVKWAKAIEQLEAYMFKILTPRGTGSGFLISKSGKIFGIATALHVIEHEYEWEEPIKIFHYSTKKQKILLKQDRVIFTHPNEDLAFILFPNENMELPDEMLTRIPFDKYIRQGIQMGWCGFPAVASDTLCFFTGHVSAYLEKIGSYLVDGVAINGVSGGPAFTIREGAPRLCGVVSAYIPNRVTGESLPGVCVIRDVAPYQETLNQLSSLEKAAEEAKAAKEAKAEKEAAIGKTQGSESSPSKAARKPAKKKTPQKVAKKKTTSKITKKSS